MTKLLQNYRSHPAILKVPNEEFYNNELQVFADKIEREKLAKWEHLAREARRNQFPVIFHGIEGEDMRQGNSPSFFNPEEVSLVKKYVKWLRETRSPRISSSQIGVISPYHMQVSNDVTSILSRSVFCHQGANGSWISSAILENEITPEVFLNVLQVGFMSLNILEKSIFLGARKENTEPCLSL